MMKKLFVYGLLLVQITMVIMGSEKNDELPVGFAPLREFFKKEYRKDQALFKQRFNGSLPDNKKGQNNGRHLFNFIFNNNFPITTKKDRDAYALAKSIALHMNETSFGKIAHISEQDKQALFANVPEEITSLHKIEQRLRTQIKTEDDLLNFKFELGVVVAMVKRISIAKNIK